MIESGKTADTEWIDEDDAPDLSTPEWAEKFHATPVRRGRPLLGSSVEVTIDADIIERFRNGGPGWQSRINAALREWLDGQ